MWLLPPAEEQRTRGFNRLSQGDGAESAGRAFAQRNSNTGVWILRFRIAPQEFQKNLAQAVEGFEHVKLLCWKR